MNRVLIVDDKEDNVYYLRTVLTGAGCTVETASHGAEALVKARRNPPDLVISDLLMPVMDGYTLLRHWKADTRLRKIPFIVYTATYTEEEDEQLALSLGADAFILKPAEPEDFLARVRQVEANAAASIPTSPKLPVGDEKALLKAYSETLIRKLEEKTLQLEEANRSLQRDLAERQAVEKALRESEARLATATDAGRIGIWDWDLLSGKVVCSRIHEELWGLQPGDFGHTYEDFRKGVHPDDYAALQAELQQAIASHREYHHEHRVVWPDGTVHWIAGRGTARYDSEGRPVQISGVAVDITERQRSDEQLKLLETCVARLKDMVVITEAEPLDEPGPRIVFVNEAFVQRTAYTRAEAIGRSPRFLQGPKTNRAELDRIRTALRAGKSVRAEVINYTKSGEEFWIELDIVPVAAPAGSFTHWVAVARDATERRRIDARFRRFVDSNAQGVLFWNARGEITGANDAFLRLVGYTREDLEAGRVNLAAVTPPEYAGHDRRALEEIAAKGVCAPFEKEYLRKDGKRVPVLVGAAAFEDNPDEGFCFVLDLTEAKKLEQQFLRAQRMDSIGTLAGGIAHDLNNVLGPIILSLDLLKLKFTDRISQDLISLIASSAQRGSAMVNQVLSFARGVEGHRVELQLKHVVRDIEKIANDTFLKHIQVRTIVPRDLWTILADPTQIHQVLLNLCVNARDAMPNGGHLTISAENLTVDPHYASLTRDARPGPYVLLQVEDTGTGVPPEIIDKIFDPFFTTKEVGKGTGLGLSTTLGIVKSHGGFIQVYSEPRKGTTFKVYLPAQTEASADFPAPVADELPYGNGELILVVDDEATVREITRQTLETFGYRVVLASEGSEAVDVFARDSAEIAAVLTDIMMPTMDGRAAIPVLLRMNPNVPIIAASGLAANAQAAQLASLGVKDFLAKPFTAETLLKTLRRVLTKAP